MMIKTSKLEDSLPAALNGEVGSLFLLVDNTKI